jgi:chemotaxis protein methyltransferase CheR
VTEKQREFKFTRHDFNFLRQIANQRTGIVVSDDKYDMFYSRLSRRVRILGLRDFAEYCELVRRDQDGEEVLELVNAITTNLTAFFRENHHFDYLTAFFRENHHFDYLARTIIPELKQKNAASKTVRIWSAGCSTGEEPYSIAITLREASAQLSGWDCRIMATDIDSNVLAKASSGIYPMDRIKGIAESRLKQWFFKGSGGNAGMVRVKPVVQQLIQFGQLNLMENWHLEDPQDVIFCRNVIIYFDKETKARLVKRYIENIKPGGYLIIGHSESLYKVSDDITLIGNTIYRKGG